MLKYASFALFCYLLACRAATPSAPAGPDTTAAADTAPTAVSMPALASAEENYATYCAGCHGEKMDAFVDRQWAHGNSSADLFKAIKVGYPNEGMPGFDATFTDEEINDLVDYMLTGIAKREVFDFQDDQLRTDTFRTEALRFHLDTILTGIEVPWAMAWLPNGDMLVTERGGTLYRRPARGGRLQTISGVPPVVDRGQGGLLDVIPHPDFANNQWVYLSYSKPHATDSRLATTAIARGKLNGNALTQVEVIFEAQPYATTRHHYGCRMVFGPDGNLYFSVGDRGDRDRNPQSLASHAGKIHRIQPDGGIPRDNPFVNTQGALPSIYSYGQRNPQGLALQPGTNLLWEHEHGPRGGDEINIIRPGNNYGWPVISYGINYDGTTFTNKTTQAGMEQPVQYWVPSIGPSGMAFVSGNRYPGWEGDLMVGSLRFKYLHRCKIEGNKVVSEEILLKNIGRLRDVRQGPDGYLYVAVEQPGAVYRLVPINQ